MTTARLTPTRFAAACRRLAIAEKGWLRAHKWWLLRRASQAGALLVFLVGPVLGLWVASGNFASSSILGVVPLSDPYILLQSVVAGHAPATTALTGALLIVVFYAIVGGRAYCGWICPVGVITDTAHWLREKLGITRDRKLDRRTRWWVLSGTLLASVATGSVAWEFVNPVSMVQRGLIFGVGFGWAIVAAVFLLDLVVTRRGWCSHLCPVGAFYGIVGTVSATRVAAARREDCTNCGACFSVCTEPQIITPALKGDGTRLIRSGACLNCGGCIDVCPVDVFEMTARGWAADPAGKDAAVRQDLEPPAPAREAA
ncbi:quinol dehydrogenase ferredoxin subunit NapH [Chthonobacter rhizosphaerae]|uniref:quinol dehydrogenase ferredoxin subunit NapH n=1 Tax=Chthonobacter rhizosphaerae TaxID=2735553 RepID=UPI0015EFCD6F|nr:quinol dehydrogenase ferredoxin subunit NapH [Chthonobacter rhizosphaerae]